MEDIIANFLLALFVIVFPIAIFTFAKYVIKLTDGMSSRDFDKRRFRNL